MVYRVIAEDQRSCRGRCGRRPGEGLSMTNGQTLAFPATHWSWIETARGPSPADRREALEGLCETYWSPIHALIRRQGYSAGDAADLAQDYFVRLIEGRPLRAADPAKGQFLAFLLADCRHFLADQRDRRQALKRGGGTTCFSLDADEAEGRFAHEYATHQDAERLFDRDWALQIVDLAFDRLARAEAEAGRGAAFEHLRVILADGPRSVPYAELAQAMGTTVAAVQNAVVRLRKRYRAAFLTEVAATLDEPDEDALDEEIGWILECLVP
jgi:DNA-directed RNA polymerase specialized sigma24 family protein